MDFEISVKVRKDYNDRMVITIILIIIIIIITIIIIIIIIMGPEAVPGAGGRTGAGGW